MRVIFLLFIIFVMASAYRHGGRERRPARHDSREINRYNNKDMSRDRDDDFYEDTVDDSDKVPDDSFAQDSDDDSGEYSDDAADEDSDDDSGEDSDEDSDEDEDLYYEPPRRQHINRRRVPVPCRFVRCFGSPLRSNEGLRPIR